MNKYNCLKNSRPVLAAVLVLNRLWPPETSCDPLNSKHFSVGLHCELKIHWGQAGLLGEYADMQVIGSSCVTGIKPDQRYRAV